ncbi:MAG: hypothetical protein ND866_07040 [Pyrinomonadaceae bacterium]|nr:hypothetical protein [Pyrinomonadaceae bacterium]
MRGAKVRGTVSDMSADAVKRIIDSFLTHGICKDEAEALTMLAKDYVQRQVSKYQERVEHFRSFYQTSAEKFAKQVAAVCQGIETIPALGHLNKQQQILQAEDDLEEWQAAEQFLVRWQAVDADLRNAPTP